MYQELVQKYQNILIQNQIDIYNYENSNFQDLVSQINEQIINDKENEIYKLLYNLFIEGKHNDDSIDDEANIDNNYLRYLIEDFLQENDIEYKETYHNINANNNFFNQILNAAKKPYTKEEEIAIFTELKQTNDTHQQAIIKREIASHYYRLILKIANRYYSYLLSVDDLFQNGVIGLYTAMDKFDLTKQTRFSTYATEWIRQKISRNACEYSLPSLNISKSAQIYQNTYNRLYRKLNRIPTDQEIIENSELSLTQIIGIKTTLPQYIELEVHNSDPNKTTTSTISYLEKEYVELQTNDYQKIENKLNNEYSVQYYIDRLITDPRQNAIIKMYIGIYPYDREYKLEQIGKHFNITRERVRQLLETSKKKIKLELSWEKNITIIDKLKNDIDITDLLNIIECSIKNIKHLEIIKRRHGLYPYSKRESLEQLQSKFQIDFNQILRILNNCYNKIENYNNEIKNYKECKHQKTIKK